MTNARNVPAYPLFRTRGRSTLHGIVLAALCIALAISSARGGGSGSAEDAPASRPAPAGRA
jgi:hypothetical protein